MVLLYFDGLVVRKASANGNACGVSCRKVRNLQLFVDVAFQESGVGVISGPINFNFLSGSCLSVVKGVAVVDVCMVGRGSQRHWTGEIEDKACCSKECSFSIRFLEQQVIVDSLGPEYK